MSQTLLSTENLLHPTQVAELKSVKAQAQATLDSPPHIRSQLQDPASVMKQITDAEKVLEQAPRPIPHDQITEAVRLESTLREKWLDGMPTQAEMRKNPPGAVDRHRKWEAKHKEEVLAWKNIRRRLHTSGISEHRLADEGDISNVEMFRPQGGGGELPMDNAQIPGTQYHLPPPGAAPAVVFSAEHIAVIWETNPALADQLVTMNNEQRAEVKEIIEAKPPEKARKTKLCGHCGEQKSTQGFAKHQEACARKHAAAE